MNWKECARRRPCPNLGYLSAFDLGVTHSVEALRYKSDAGSIPSGGDWIFNCLNPSVRSVAMESTQSLREMSTRNISWGVNATGVRA
jgi:hypothetical protein